MNNDKYQKVISLVKILGKPLVKMSGSIADIGINKKWVTEQDFIIEKEIAKLIKTFGDNHKVYAEELHNNFEECDEIWIIDPISNTKGFINGWYHFAIVLSHMRKGILQFALVYDPAVDELFTAYKNNGAFLNETRISVSPRKDDLYFLFPSTERKPLSVNQNGELVKELIKLGSLRNIGSVGLHYAYVACGRADCAITINKDCFPEFAGKLLLEESGGKLTDFYGNELSEVPMGIIASRSDIYPKIKSIMDTILKMA